MNTNEITYGYKRMQKEKLFEKTKNLRSSSTSKLARVVVRRKTFLSNLAVSDNL